LSHSPQWRSTVRTLSTVQWEDLHGQITCTSKQPSPAVVPLHLCTNRINFASTLRRMFVCLESTVDIQKAKFPSVLFLFASKKSLSDKFSVENSSQLKIKISFEESHLEGESSLVLFPSILMVLPPLLVQSLTPKQASLQTTSRPHHHATPHAKLLYIKNLLVSIPI
jgi:hypothetical protein